MRRVLVVASVLVLGACTAGRSPGPAPSPGAVAPEARPSTLAAAEPVAPTLAEFREHATLACTTAAAAIQRAGLRGDPLHRDARPADVRAAIGHYRAAAQAWTAAAGQLWEFGLPKGRAGRSLITSLDTVAQYSQQAAEFLQAGDRPSAQAAVGGADEAMRQANRVAERIGVGRLEECGRTRPTLSDPQRELVVAADFTFGVGAVRPGRTRFVLRNDGDEDHQLFVVRLRDTGTVDDAVREDRAGGDPGRYLVGDGQTSPVVGPGERGRVDVRLRAGPYALVCMVASEDGTPHAFKGMATEIFVSR